MSPDHLFLTHRELLRRCGMGFGALSLAGMLGQPASASAVSGVAPLAPKGPHFPAKAKRVIHLFMNGGPSHVDTFDPKPSLEKYAGKLLPRENLKHRAQDRGGVSFAVQIQQARPERASRSASSFHTSPQACG